jgi:hypothetical protein
MDSLGFTCALYLEEHESNVASDVVGAQRISTVLASGVRRAVAVLESAKRYSEALDLLRRVLGCRGR